MFMGSWLCLYYFHIALFSVFLCCTFLILKNTEIQRKSENTNKKATVHSEPRTCLIFILISYNTFLSLYSFEWLIKGKGTNLLLLENNMFAKDLDVDMDWNLFLPDPKYLTDMLFMTLRMNGLRKNMLVLKKTPVGITLF